MYTEFSKSQIKALLKKYIDETDSDSFEFNLPQSQVKLILQTYIEELPIVRDFE